MPKSQDPLTHSKVDAGIKRNYTRKLPFFFSFFSPDHPGSSSRVCKFKWRPVSLAHSGGLIFCASSAACDIRLKCKSYSSKCIKFGNIFPARQILERDSLFLSINFPFSILFCARENSLEIVLNSGINLN